MLSKNLKLIKQDLDKYKDKTPIELFHDCIHQKLYLTLQRYNEEIDFNSDYLLTRSSTKVLKAITKIQKRDDKNVLEEMINEDGD